MHKIFELKGMEVEQLQNLASELGVKGFKKMDKEALVYSILDEEARQNAQNMPDKPVQKKRGRPKKTEVKVESLRSAGGSLRTRRRQMRRQRQRKLR